MREPITLMHVLFRFGIGGLENGLVNLINGLDREDYRHVIVCLADYDTEFLRRVQVPNIEIHALHKRPGQDPRVWWRMGALLRRVRPTVLHTRNFASLELQVLGWLYGVHGRVHGEHGWDVQDLDGSQRKYRVARRVLGHCVHRFVALSRHLEHYLVKEAGIAPRKVVQIYNGVDSEAFQPPSTPRSEGELVVGTVGRMTAVKNQTLLCRAFLALLTRRPDLVPRLRLRLVGDGPLRAECAALAAQAGHAQRVELVGDSQQVARELRAMDIFVLPSLAEGISNTILEAMASGLPVIATAVGGNRELVVENETGMLVASGDADAMSAAIECYVCDDELRRRHGARGREWVATRYGLPRMIADYDRLYRELAA